jgi:hypothetical protein
MAGKDEASVIVPVVLKVIVSSVPTLLASIMACLREPVPESFRFETTKLAGVIRSSSPKRSRRLK